LSFSNISKFTYLITIAVKSYPIKPTAIKGLPLHPNQTTDHSNYFFKICLFYFLSSICKESVVNEIPIVYNHHHSFYVLTRQNKSNQNGLKQAKWIQTETEHQLSQQEDTKGKSGTGKSL
jgi:hypothetical protein